MNFTARKTTSARWSVVVMMMLAGGVATAQEHYVLNVIEESAKGRAILSERYESAITTLESSNVEGLRGFYADNNLCVAYIKTGDLDKAARACDSAVMRMQAQLRLPETSRAGKVRRQTHREMLAVALSNRGVLAALAGNKDDARTDFLAARDLRQRLSALRANLKRLDSEKPPAV